MIRKDKQLHASTRCIDAIKAVEAFTSPARHLPGDRPNVITGAYGDIAVYEGQCFTVEQGDRMLRDRIALTIEPLIYKLVDAPLSQGQLDSLVSLIYNIGAGNFLNSTLLKDLERGDLVAAAFEFSRWIRADGKILPGLVKRRAMERDWFTEAFSSSQHELLAARIAPHVPPVVQAA